MANNIKRFDPFGEVVRFEPFRNVEDFFREFRMMPSLRSNESEPRIRLDMSESDQAYTVKAEIPGVKKDDIKVSIEGNQVSISAELRKEEENKNGNMMHSERYYGQQYRSFTLPQDIDDTKADAKYHDGILELTLPKKPGGGGKKLTVH